MNMRKQRPFLNRSLALLPLLLLLASLMPFLSGCQSPAVAAAAAGPATGQAAGYRFQDDRGVEVFLPRQPERVAALMGSYAETWLLAGGQLAGVTSDALTDWDLNLSGKAADLGSLKEPNLEKLLALSPDFVILSPDIEGHLKLDQRLKDLGIAHAYFKVETFPEYLHMLSICTGITGSQTLYQKNGLDVKARIADILAARKPSAMPAGKPKVLLIRAFSSGVKARKDDNMTGSMLAEFGCDNIAMRQLSLLDSLSIEAIIAEDPDYIFVETMGADTAQALAALDNGLKKSPAWSQLSAVKNNRCIVLPKELFHYKPNAKWDQAYAYLADIFNQ